MLHSINHMYVFVSPEDGSRKVSGEGSMPTYGCQVTIQSEQEKQLMKTYRREEKRERKRGKGIDDIESIDSTITFDPREMRVQRYTSYLGPLPLCLCPLCPVSCIHLCSPSRWQASASLPHRAGGALNEEQLSILIIFSCRGFLWKFTFSGW